ATLSALRRTRSGGRSVPITANFAASAGGLPRVAYAVGRKVGAAVVRNRLRRRLRAAVTDLAPMLAPGAALFGALPEAAPVVQALPATLAFWYGLIPSYGLAITLMTVVVMVVLAPLTWKGTRSMLEMQRLQPEIKKIQARHKDDRQKANEEMMAFYKEHKI